jgi:ADP-heptose:LPS heptosyltransferase
MGSDRTNITPPAGFALPARPRILIVALDNLGDLVFASALPPAIRARYPDATIGLWCKAYSSPIAPLIPDVDWVVAADPFWDGAPGHPSGSIRHFVRALRRVRQARFDVALLASPQWRVAAAVAATRVPSRIGQRRSHNRHFLTSLLPPASRQRPVVDDLGTLLEPIDARRPILTTCLDPTPLADRTRALRDALGQKPVAAINPFVTLAPVGIPIDRWIAVAHALVTRGYTVVWVGTRSQLTRFHETTPLQPGWQSALDLIPDGTLAGATALLAAADVYLGCDSGPLHLSAALGIPVVGVFPNVSKLPRFAPQGRGPSRLVTPADGTTEITPDQILGALDLLAPPHRRVHFTGDLHLHSRI